MGIQTALKDDGNANGKMNSSNCKAPAGREIQTAFIDEGNASGKQFKECSRMTATPTGIGIKERLQKTARPDSDANGTRNSGQRL
jgi:hypothetical protein